MFRKLFFVTLIIFILCNSLAIAQAPDIGGRVVFVSDRDGNQNLWIYDLKTNETYRITDFPDVLGISRVMFPRWSPDGKMISFGAEIKNDRYSYEIFGINDDGTNLTQLTSIPDYRRAYISAWDPSNRELLYFIIHTPAYSGIIHSLNLVSGVDIEIPLSSGRNTHIIDISTDGTKILFSREPSCCWTPQMYTGYQDLEGLNERIIKPTDNHAEWIGRINRIDNWIIYHQATHYYAPVNVYKMDENGDNVTKLTFGTGGESNHSPVWADGNNEGYIIFQSNKSGNWEIVLMRADPFEYPDGIINLTNDIAFDGYPDWTPLSANEPPVAVCRDIEISADENCQASIVPEDVDGGSYDPDEGDTITISVDNMGPFYPGERSVNLTVTDQEGESDTCQATVIVVDTTLPIITITDPICVNIGPGKGRMANKLTVSAEDNCSSEVVPTIDMVELYNKGGDLVRGTGLYEIIGQDIFVYANAREWTIRVTATAIDESGNAAAEILDMALIQCKK